MIHIINYGLGNLGSIQNMLGRIGAESVIASSPADLKNVTQVILPGVGAFDTGMNHLKKNHWLDSLNELVIEKKVPVLGICLGMQLMTNSSEEGNEKGLGWINAETVKFPVSAGRIPHMGWNITSLSKSSRLMADDHEEKRFYFVHSYYVKLNNQADEVLSADYGTKFTAGFEVNNIVGVQFHPEKSHRYGMELLRNFVINFRYQNQYAENKGNSIPVG